MMKKNILYILSAYFMLIWVGCKKTDPVLEGGPSQSNFSTVITSVPDSLPFVQKVTFTNTSTDAFVYKWDFGDGGLSAEKSPSHIYTKGSTYTVKLTSVGKAGNNESTKSITVADACGNDTFNKLTNCGTQVWTWSSEPDAIKVLSADGSQVYFAGPAAGCQVDDKFSFLADGSFKYNANGETFSVQAGYSCQPALANATSFKLAAKTGTIPKIVLNSKVAGGGKPFIGTTDLVKENAYQIMSITADKMTLRGTLLDGALIEFKFKLPSDLDNVKLLLTGGSSRSWKLDAAKVPGPITVGPNDAAPTGYFGGGPLASCQIDDKYTFTQANGITYDGGDGTFVAGQSCQAARNFTTTFTFTNVAGGAGIGQINLPVNNQFFIGVTDRPNENVYRILSIDNDKMVLRAGNGTSGLIFDLFFIRAN